MNKRKHSYRKKHIKLELNMWTHEHIHKATFLCFDYIFSEFCVLFDDSTCLMPVSVSVCVCVFLTELLNGCLSSPCDPSAQCINLVGGFKCMCQNGWQMSADGKVCTEVTVTTPSTTPCIGYCSNNGSCGYRQNGEPKCTYVQLTNWI